MPTTPISAVMANTNPYVQTTSKTTDVAASSQSDFMMMLMAQLKNQNPMDPMDDKDLMGQVAQLNSLQQLTAISTKMAELTKTSQAGYASSLIGRFIQTSPEDGSPGTEGVVDGMEFANGEYFLSLDGEMVRLADVSLVKEQEG